MSFRVTISSHPGLVRASNQDQVVVSNLIGNGKLIKTSQFRLDSPELVAVLDGMGGHIGGQVAAQVAATALSSYAEPPPEEAALDLLINTANDAVYDRMSESQELAGMGVTVVAVVPNESGWIVGHVGDARAYAVSHGLAVLLTEDDRRASGALTQSLGGLVDRTAVTVHLSTQPYGSCERVLLCTDGLSDVVPFAEIQNALGEPDDCVVVNRLLEACLQAGGPDNVTMALVSRDQ